MRTFPGTTLLFFAALTLMSSHASATCTATTAMNVQHEEYDLYRTSSNTNETTLTPSNVNSTQFGYLFKIAPTVGLIYAQPLVLHNFTIGGTNYCTVVFLATMGNQIFAYRGDTGALIWSSGKFKTAGGLGVPAAYCKFNAGFTQAGILSTPYIDTVHLLMYFVTLNDTGQSSPVCPNGTSVNWVYTLHAISLQSGAAFGTDYFPPVDISGSFLGVQNFTANVQLQRPGILVVNGIAFVMFGFGTTGGNSSTEENETYYGWTFAYKSCAPGDTSCATLADPGCFSSSNCTLQQVQIQAMTFPVGNDGEFAQGHGAGVWMSGRAPATDGSYVAWSTGNACYAGLSPTTGCVGNPLKSGATGADYYGDAVITQSLADTFGSWGFTAFIPTDTLQNESPGAGEAFYLDDYNDQDISTGGVMMVPPTPPNAQSSFLLAAGKAGYLYSLPSPLAVSGSPYNPPVQKLLATASGSGCLPMPTYPNTYEGGGGCDEIHSLAFWNLGSTSYLYLWGFGDVARAFSFNTSTGLIAPVAQATFSQGSGGMLAVTSNQANPSTGILWAVSSSADLYLGGQVTAYQLWSGTGPELVPIWNSSTASTFANQRYVDPVVSYGSVYVSTIVSGNGTIYVFGLCSSQAGGCKTQGT